MKYRGMSSEMLAAMALASGIDARRMVLNRDPRLVHLEAVAAEFGSVTGAADVVHADLYAKYDEAMARAMQPGPEGPRGPAGPDGKAGAIGLSGTASLALGAAPVGLLALGASVDVVVKLSRSMPNTTYSVQPAHSAVVGLANVTFAINARTTTSVTVRVTSSGLALAAGTLIVAAY